MPGTLIRRLQFASLLADLLDLTGDRLDALVEPEPVLVEADDQVGSCAATARRRGSSESRRAIGAGRWRRCADGDPMLDEEGADLVDRRRAARHQARAHAMAGLQVELILRLLAARAQVGAQSRLGDGLGIVVVVLLTLHERLDVDRRDDARRVPEPAQRAADEVGAEASLEPDDARRQLLERRRPAPAA